MGHKNDSKQYFLTGKKPTQGQFANMHDWLRWADENIAMADITGLVAALLAKVDKSDYEGQLIEMDGPYTYAIPGGYLLEKIMPYYGEAGAMQISLAAYGETDELDKDDVAAGWNRPIQLDIFAEDNTEVFIDGIPDGSKIIFFKRKIKIN